MFTKPLFWGGGLFGLLCLVGLPEGDDNLTYSHLSPCCWLRLPRMFALSELTCLHEPSRGSKLLKPWWEVFMDCLLVLMLMLSVLAGTVLLSRDKVVCLPVVEEGTTTATTAAAPPATTSASSSTSSSSSVARSNHSSPAGGSVPVDVWVAKHKPLVYQQYVFISQVCVCVYI